MSYARFNLHWSHLVIQRIFCLNSHRHGSQIPFSSQAGRALYPRGVLPTFLYRGTCQYLVSEILQELVFGICELQFTKNVIFGSEN